MDSLAWGEDPARVLPDIPASTRPESEAASNGEPVSTAALRRLRRERLSADAPHLRVGEAVERAKVRLVSSGTPPRARDAAWLGLALLAAGEFPRAYDLLRLLGERQDSTGSIPDDHATPHEPDGATGHYLLLGARTLAWTGDVFQLGREWDRIRQAGRFLMQAGVRERAGAPRPVGPGDAQGAGAHSTLSGHASMSRVALHELAIAAESMGDTEIAAAPGERRPNAEQDGLVGPAHEPGTADAGLLYDGTDEATLFVLRLVHGLLGAEPDAARGRLVLRPRIPRAWDRFELRRLRVGDAAVALRYRREDTRHVFRLEQERGAVPLRLIFEPLLPARALAGARVDGEPAELDPRRAGQRLVVPVQLVLDHERSVELEAAAGAPGNGCIPDPN